MNLEELHEVAATADEKAKSYRHCLRVCTAASCQSSGAADVISGLKDLAGENGGDKVCVKGVGCLGLCSAGPLVGVDAAGTTSEVLYQNVRSNDVRDVYAGLNKGPVERLPCRPASSCTR